MQLTPAGHVTWSYKLSLFAVYMVTYAALYIYPNHVPFGPTIQLPMVAIDNWVPFLPWTFFIYISDYVLFAVVIFLLREPVEFHAYARKMFLSIFICGTFFFFCPTTYPRVPYPETANWALDLTMRIIAVADAPTNCFPSMHVALTGIAAWAVRHKGWKVNLALWIWTLAVVVSTLTTKQHYFADVVGGFAVITFVAALDSLLYERRTLRTFLARK